MGILKKESGITLIALVVTIIVLLILAGVSIAMLTGENGILTRADTARKETEKAKIIEDLELAYLDVYTSENLNIEPITVEMLIEKLIKDYGYKQEQFSKVITKNLDLSNTNVKLRTNNSQDIDITLDNNLVTTYFALIKGKYYKINFEENNFTLGEVKDTLPDKEEIVTTVESGNNIITVELEGNTITITGKEGQTGKATVKVSYGAIDKTIEVKVNDLIVDIGDVIINNKVLENDWQYFCEDETSIYLIYDEYLEHNMIPTAEKIIIDEYRVHVDLSKVGIYRWDLIDYLNDTNIWSNIANSVKSAIEAKGVKIDGEVTARGTPAITLLKKAFNEIYGEEKFEIKNFKQYDNNGGDSIIADGYLFRLIGDEKYFDRINIPTDNRVFFPHNEEWNETWGYWLADPGAVGAGDICYVDCMGVLTSKPGLKQDVGIRPVVKIPKSDNLINLLNFNKN